MKRLIFQKKTVGKNEGRNPYLAPLVIHFPLMLFFTFAFWKWNSLIPYSGIISSSCRILIIMIITFLYVMNVADVIGFFKFRKFKKKHPGPGFDQHYFEMEGKMTAQVASPFYRAPRLENRKNR